MSAFADVRKTAWDTETTGPNPLEDRIVSAAFIVRAPGAEDLVFTWLINPGIPIPAEATAVHGIDDAKVQGEGREPKEALEELASYLAHAINQGMPVIAFNHSFDWSILHYDLLRNGLPTMAERVGPGPLPLIDPHVIDKELFKYVRGQGNRKLGPTAERYNVALNDWHTADADALAALLIAEEQFVRFARELGHLGPEQLFAAQQRWRAGQQASLQDWFRKKATPEQGGDPNKVIDGSWPLIPAQRTGGDA
ncbi:DNA polymerase III subunit epsilon [Streptomyces alfalfae]|uniref:DNA polymerase III subunit epsilon n=1 Tax=Streptomyces alfalfae TaxID=1642299 RepID=A0ABM6GWG6_9ACTN|nr:exonuclease domain-containing protein [Streptomyces alfalfae]APY88217.1 DNA polymerase III subunit epsilon [Streptomyces alfalfae]AYA18613.1 DNA polymerase III subunit epsilon [Streptomyces fradiae]RXX46507.1 DNA polymerase III subunit epsilon [Streptomyces alfalfae]RZM90020.1 DNA polymerase III subunit epsilon [Streptomyces alfalfae]